MVIITAYSDLIVSPDHAYEIFYARNYYFGNENASIMCRTLRGSWDELKHETEASGRIHIGLAQKVLDDIHHTVKEFREQQRDIRKKVGRRAGRG